MMNVHQNKHNKKVPQVTPFKRSQNAEDMHLLEDYLSDRLTTKTDSDAYADNLRLCVIELASLEVAIENTYSHHHGNSTYTWTRT